MSKKVIVTQRGITHYYALCLTCGWSKADHIDRAYVRYNVNRHVRATGHVVSIEKGVVTVYKPAGSKT